METTWSTRQMEKMTGTHKFKIMGHSADKVFGKTNCTESAIFYVGGHNWTIQYYPNGCCAAEKDDISIYLHLETHLEDVKAQVNFTILDQSGCALPLSKKTEIFNFRNLYCRWGFSSFCKRAKLEAYIKDDCFVIESVVTVFKDFLVEPTEQIVVPPSNMQQQLGDLLKNGNGTDVTFQVDGKTFSAHKCILAARSPVFWAQFSGRMKWKLNRTIKIKEMEAPVFKALLHFIYNDSFPGFEENKNYMAHHLLVAADRYGLERLKIICEKMLCGSVDRKNVFTLMPLAERHSCNYLKAACLKFSASCGILLGAEIISK